MPLQSFQKPERSLPANRLIKVSQGQSNYFSERKATLPGCKLALHIGV